MRELLREIPDPDLLLELTPEELGAKLLFLARRRIEQSVPRQDMIHPGNFTLELNNSTEHDPSYPRHKLGEVALALSEAWAWVEAQGLIVPAPNSNAQNGWRVLSRRARRFEDETDLAPFAAARMLPKDLLHPTISERCWLLFMRGEYDLAVLQAMKQVEITLRRSTGIGDETPAVGVARQAFHIDTGSLTDMQAARGEREAMAHLFAGALGVFKNPHSHRNVDLTDPAEAAAVIMFASHLLRIVEARAAGAAVERQV